MQEQWVCLHDHVYKKSGRVSGGVRVCGQCVQLSLVLGKKSKKNLKTRYIGHGKSFVKVEYIAWKNNTRFYNALSMSFIKNHVVWSMWVGDGVKSKKYTMFGWPRLFQIWLCEPQKIKSSRKIRNENIFLSFFSISNYKTYIFSPRRRRPKRLFLEGYASLRRWKCKLT